MLTVTLGELQVNAIRAALADRVRQQGRVLCELKEHRDSSDNAFAIACVEAAIRDAILASMVLNEAMAEPDYPEDMTIARFEDWAPGEVAEAWGK